MTKVTMVNTKKKYFDGMKEVNKMLLAFENQLRDRKGVEEQCRKEEKMIEK